MSITTPNSLKNLAGIVLAEEVILKMKTLYRFKESMENIYKFSVAGDKKASKFNLSPIEMKILKKRYLDLHQIFQNWLQTNGYDKDFNFRDIGSSLLNCTKKFHFETFIARYFISKEIYCKSCHLADPLMKIFLGFLKLKNKEEKGISPNNYKINKLTIGSFCSCDCPNIYNDNDKIVRFYNFDISCIDEAGCSGLTCFKNVNGLCGGITFSNISEFCAVFTNVSDLTAIVDEDSRILESFSNYSNLRFLTLFTLKGYFNCNDLSKFFFDRCDLPHIKKCDIKLRKVNLTFPILESLTFGWVKPDQYDFFNMFVNFYGPQCHLTIYLGAETVHSAGLSWFEQVLSHNVIINPLVALTECELVFKDLFLPITSKSFDAWRNFTKLTLNLGCDKNQTTPYLINYGKKFDEFLKKYCKINNICFRISKQVSEAYVIQTVKPALKNFGTRFESLSIMGSEFFLNHKSISAIVNLCPNIQELKIVGERIDKYEKSVKFIQLSQLKKMVVVSCNLQKKFASINSESVSKLSLDLIKSANKLTQLHISANTYLLNRLTQTEISKSVTTLAIDLHLVKQELEDIYDFEEFKITKEEKTKDRSFLKRKLQVQKIISSDLGQSLFKVLKALPEVTELMVKISAGAGNSEYLLSLITLGGNAAISQLEYIADGNIRVKDDIFFDALKHYLHRTQINIRHFEINDVFITL